LDGTLVDSRRDIADSANALLESCGAPRLPEERIGQMVGDGAATLVARAFEASHIERPADALDRYLVLYHERLLDHTVPYPGMVDTLDALAGRTRLAVLTNKPRRSTQEILDGLDLARFFPPDAVIAGDGPFPRKPDPSGLRQLQAEAAVDADCALLVGDSIIDWRTARAAGTAVCLARYGFGFSSFAGTSSTSDDRPIDLTSTCDVRLIDAPRDLLDIVL
jgi:phosphoglycolate phosphatase